MNDNWTDAERLAARVLASGSEDALRDLLAELDKGYTGAGDSESRERPGRRRRFGIRPSFRRKHRGRERRGWWGRGLLDPVADAVVVLIALACILLSARPLATPVVESGASLSDVLGGIPSPVPQPQPSGIASVTAEDRPVASSEPISLIARDLEATVRRYRDVSEVYAQNKLPCTQLRESYTAVEDAWVEYSIARGRTYGDRLPANLRRWDEALYEGVQDVDRDFTASGCQRP